jgi:hypothetical protein
VRRRLNVQSLSEKWLTSKSIFLYPTFSNYGKS